MGHTFLYSHVDMTDKDKQDNESVGCFQDPLIRLVDLDNAKRAYPRGSARYPYPTVWNNMSWERRDGSGQACGSTAMAVPGTVPSLSHAAVQSSPP